MFFFGVAIEFSRLTKFKLYLLRGQKTQREFCCNLIIRSTISRCVLLSFRKRTDIFVMYRFESQKCNCNSSLSIPGDFSFYFSLVHMPQLPSREPSIKETILQVNCSLLFMPKIPQNNLNARKLKVIQEVSQNVKHGVKTSRTSWGDDWENGSSAKRTTTRDFRGEPG